MGADVSNGRRLQRSVRRGQAAGDVSRAAAEGRINGYLCGVCNRYTVTVDVHDGVTPMFLTCRASGDSEECLGRATSMMYADPATWPNHGQPRAPQPEWEWYKPVGVEADRIRHGDPQTWDHVRRGGLLLRPHRRGNHAAEAALTRMDTTN